MSSINDAIIQAKDRYLQAKRRQQLQDNRDKEAQRKLDTRRKIIIGAIFAEIFPYVRQFQPRRTQAENTIEFAPLRELLVMIAEDKDYIAQLQERVRIKLSSENPQQ